DEGRDVPGHLHRAVRPRPPPDADARDRDGARRLREVAEEPGQGRLGRQRRRRRVPEQRLQRLSHARRRRSERHRRARPRQAPRGSAARAPAARGIHARVDRRPRQVRGARLSQGCDAADVRIAAEGPAGRARAVSRRVESERRLVTTTVAEAHDLHAAHVPKPPPTGIRRWTAPGWLRVFWVTPFFYGIGFGITVLVRWAEGWDPVVKWSTLTVTALLVAAPIGFLVGLGGFDYWMRWAIGAPTIPEDHSGHGARSWKDYFRINTDHKVIGIQYLV